MKLVFLGSDEFGLPALERLAKAGHEIAAIVSTPAKPKGRGLKVVDSAVVTYTKQHEYQPIFTPENLKDSVFISSLKALEPQLFVVAAFRILPPEVFTIPSLSTINIHASLLPLYRGPAPIQRAIAAGESRTGVTIFAIDRGIDTGRIILQRELTIGPKETSPQLHARLSELGAEAIVEAVALLEAGEVSYVEQDERFASRAPKLAKEEAVIDWHEEAATIYNRIRAFKPFPGTYTVMNGRRLGIEWAEPLEAPPDFEPGTVCAVSKDWFEVQCGKGRLRVLEVKPEGRKHMDAGAFMRGSALACGVELG